MMQNNCSIIPMEACHTKQVAELETLCFSDPWSLRSVESELTNPLSLWLVAMADDQVVGYIGSQTVLDEADIMNVAVHPAYRRTGIAAALLQELQSRLTANAVHSLTLEVRASNDAAICLYHRLGYMQVGRRPNYYRTPKEDALILRKEWSL